MLQRRFSTRSLAVLSLLAIIFSICCAANAGADENDVQLMLDAITQEIPVQERILKWREPVRIVLYHEDPAAYPDRPILGLAEGRAVDIVGKLNEILGLQIFYRRSPFKDSLEYAVDLKSNTVDIYLIDRSNFDALEQAFVASQSDRSNAIVPLLQYAISVGRRPDSYCVFTLIFDSESYIVKSVGVIDLGVHDTKVLQCFSRILLFSLGYGEVLQAGTHSVTAQPNEINEPTAFDYDVLRLLYDDMLLPRVIENEADRAAVEAAVAQILRNAAPE